MIDNKRLENAVKRILTQQFRDVVIESITIERDVDEDGEPILWVRVIFDGQRRHLDAQKTSGALRHILPKIREMGEEAFPIISYISKSDYRRSTPDPA